MGVEPKDIDIEAETAFGGAEPTLGEADPAPEEADQAPEAAGHPADQAPEAAGRPANQAADPVFAAEQAHLTSTYDTLLRMARELVAKMERTDAQAAADKQSMSEELAPNFATYADAMETYADFAAMNRVIEAYNVSQEVDAERLRSIRALLRQPYFAKVELQYKPGAEPRAFYIGTAGISDDNCRRMVVDWRSPVAEVYYNQDNGPTSYAANGRTINVDLKLRRQFDIVGNRLNAYFDTTVAIQDALLLSSLSQQRTAQMKAITATIQREQNQVVRHADVPALLVSGIAGSGKTSVLMQRIAYLFYQNRETLDPREVFLITPNPVFRRYVEDVLPDLGERNPEMLTWDEFAQDLLPSGSSAHDVAAAPADLRRIDQALAQGIALEPGDFREVRHEETRFFTSAQIQQVRAKFGGTDAGPRLITLVREELVRRFEGRLAQMSTREEVQDEVSALGLNEQLRLFGETFDPQDEQEAAQLTLRYLRERYAPARAAIESDEWLRIDRIGMRLLGVPSLSAMTWLYLKMALTGLGNPQAKYVMVDEVQDYTTAQLMVLARYFRRANFLLLGDENQAIEEGTATFADIAEVLRSARGEVSTCRLMTSYRSTPEVTALFASLLGEQERGCVASVQRAGSKPQVVECASDAAWEESLISVAEGASAEVRERGGLVALVAPHKGEAKRLARILASAQVDAMLVARGDALPASGVVVIPLQLAKGLEFDHVIVPDASERVFPAEGSREDACENVRAGSRENARESARIAKNRLYTTISRATRKVTLIAKGQVTGLLKVL